VPVKGLHSIHLVALLKSSFQVWGSRGVDMECFWKGLEQVGAAAWEVETEFQIPYGFGGKLKLEG
jgi:hypothetical protein